MKHRALVSTPKTLFLTFPNDTYISKSLAMYGEWSYGEVEIFSLILRKTDNVIEVGSNIGGHTVFIGRDIVPQGKIFAFEPRRVLFQMLCANLMLNEVENVLAYQLGAGGAPGSCREGAMNVSVPVNAGGFALGQIQGEGEIITVVRLDDVIPEHENVALLKIDVEGHERDVILGAIKTIQRTRPILYVENDRPDNARELLKTISGLGYEIWLHLAPLFRTNNIANVPLNIFGQIMSVNVVCFPRERGVAIERLPKLDTSDFQFRANSK